MAALSREETARAKFTFSIYDFDGSNKIDAFQLGNALRALNLNPSLKRISNLGGTIQRNEKMLSVDEFLAIYQEAKKDKQEGTFEEYLEVLSGYDKDRTGKISATTLGHLLQGYGEERLPRDEAEEVIEECGKPDDERMVDYKKFLNNLMTGPEIKIPIAMLRATEIETDSGLDTSAAPTPVAQLSRKNTHCKSRDSIAPPPALNEELVNEKLSSEKQRERRASDKPAGSTLPQEDNEKGITQTSTSQPDQEDVGLSSKPRNSRKSRGSVKKEDNTTDLCSELAADEVADDISRGEEEQEVSTISSARSSKKSTGKRSSKKASSPEVSMASDTSGGDLTSARSSLKSGKSRSSTKTLEGKEETPSVKAKLQQPLISLKTQGLISTKK